MYIYKKNRGSHVVGNCINDIFVPKGVSSVNARKSILVSMYFLTSLIDIESNTCNPTAILLI